MIRMQGSESLLQIENILILMYWCSFPAERLEPRTGPRQTDTYSRPDWWRIDEQPEADKNGREGGEGRFSYITDASHLCSCWYHLVNNSILYRCKIMRLMPNRNTSASRSETRNTRNLHEADKGKGYIRQIQKLQTPSMSSPIVCF